MNEKYNCFTSPEVEFYFYYTQSKKFARYRGLRGQPEFYYGQ